MMKPSTKMMSSKLTHIFLIFVLSSAVSAQENKLFWDGNDWNRLSRQTAGYPEYAFLVKSSYINGVMDGRLYDYFKTWRADSLVADSVLGNEIVDYLKTSELVRGLDNFYADPLHAYIPITSAVIIVNMLGEGQPTEMIEAYTLKSKEWINSLMLRMQEEDQFHLMQEKQKKHMARKKRNGGGATPPE